VQVGEAVTQGQPAYLNSTDVKYYQADADASAAAANVAGIFLTPAAADGYAVLATLGPINVGATLTVGESYYASDTKGGIKPSADLASDDWVTLLGIATTTSKLELSIQVSGVQVP
jgi:hypothetical protein